MILFQIQAKNVGKIVKEKRKLLKTHIVIILNNKKSILIRFFRTLLKFNQSIRRGRKNYG